jgi:hypothetical protein
MTNRLFFIPHLKSLDFHLLLLTKGGFYEIINMEICLFLQNEKVNVAGLINLYILITRV